MWEFECSTETAGSRAAVWALWSDPTRWSEFDPGITRARIEEPFVAGAKIKVKPKGGPPSTIELTAAEPEQGFATMARLPLARLGFEHELSDTGDGKTRITSRIRLTGPLSRVYPRLFRLRRNELEMQANLARMAAAADAAAAGTPGS